LKPAYEPVYRLSKSLRKSVCSINGYLTCARNLEAFDTVSPHSRSVQGRLRKIHYDAEEGVKDFLDSKPDNIPG
jgi:hypothetical protein